MQRSFCLPSFTSIDRYDRLHHFLRVGGWGSAWGDDRVSRTYSKSHQRLALDGQQWWDILIGRLFVERLPKRIEQNGWRTRANISCFVLNSFNGRYGNAILRTTSLSELSWCSVAAIVMLLGWIARWSVWGHSCAHSRETLAQWRECDRNIQQLSLISSVHQHEYEQLIPAEVMLSLWPPHIGALSSDPADKRLLDKDKVWR